MENNMKKSIMIVSFLICFSLLTAAEFIVSDFKEQPMSIELQRNPVKDVNGEYSALIKISTDLLPFTFETNIGVVKTEKKTGEFWAYVPAGTSQLIFTKEGFKRFRFSIPISVKANSVYLLKMDSTGYGISLEDENLVNITFKLPEASVYISKDNSSPIESKNSLVEFRLPKGIYTFKFFKEGRSSTREINANEDKVVTIELDQTDTGFELKLPGIIKVESKPEEAAVYIDNQKFGYTPLQASISAGSHTVKLVKNRYYSQTLSIDVLEGKILEIPKVKLTPNFGTLNVTTKPDSCDIFLDGKKIGRSPLEDYPITNGVYQLRAERQDYSDITQEIRVVDSKPAHVELVLSYGYGGLVVHSLPEEGATVYIDDVEVGVTPFTESRKEVGKYSLKIAKKYWIGSEVEAEVVGNEDCIKKIILTPNFSNYKIIAADSDIYIDDALVGKNMVTTRLTAGKHGVEARKGDHARDYREIFCIAGEDGEVTLEPKTQYASLTVLTTPQDTEGAEIFINRKRCGASPWVSKVLVGRNDVVVKHPKYITMKQSVDLGIAEQKTLTFDMQLYKGSAFSKTASWRRSKWISLAGAVLISGAGYYCNITGDAFQDDYKKSTTTAAAMQNYDDAESWYSKRDMAYSISIVPAAWFVYSWIKEAGYKKQTDK
jgi:hypothetical protein